MFSHIKELFTRPSGYTISRSVRLRSSASAYFNRTLTTPTNNKIWTWSGWVKRGILGTTTGRTLFRAGVTSPTNGIRFEATTDVLRLFFNDASSGDLVTTQVFRDPSAWYHIIVVVDTTQATAANRVKIYINGAQVTAFSTASYPAQNYDPQINSAILHTIGAFNASGTPAEFFDGYMTEVNFIDGQALTPSSFGETDSITGVWKAKKYSGTYGTNGFYLNFSDNSSNTATTIGKDYSGNGNNWTPNNISVTAGATYDSMVDSPTVSAVSSNYAVWNQLQKTSTLSQANLLSAGGGSAIFYSVASTISIPSGKWYWEITCVSNTDGLTGIVETNQMINVIRNGNYVGQTSLGYGYHANGNKYNNGSSSAYGSSYTTGDVIGVAFDADNRTLTFYKNNVSQGTAFTVTSGYTWLPADSVYTSDSKAANFGQRPFSYTPPTGFVALNTYNLPASTITNGAAYMAATTYTGNGSTQSISNAVNGVSFQPDLVWGKSRSAATSHLLVDSVRGTNAYLLTNSTAAEGSASNTVTSFNSGGFSLGADTTLNTNASTYVGWQWKAGGSSSSNTNGSITSTVSVGATQGFSVVTYTGTGVAATIGHGLGVAPSMVITKVRSTANNWGVYHSGINDPSKALLLDSTAAAASYGGATGMWNNTAPTSTVFSVGVNGSTGASATYVAYCFAAVAGYSAFGSYTGNASTDGPFIYTGFRPRFVMAKNITNSAGATNWVIQDSSRNGYNPNKTLYANASSAEDSSAYFDILSNGFKVRDTFRDVNTSGDTYIYMAFAESPLKYALAR